MDFEFNHTFSFVEPGFPDEAKLQKKGFTPSSQREHLGQGTTAKFLIFEKNYLEFIWLSNRKDSEKNEIELYKRADFIKTGWCPFGIALSGTPDSSFGVFFEYKPPYSKNTIILIDQKSMESKNYPLIFFMKQPTGEGAKALRPENLYKDSQKKIIDKHSISSLEYSGPSITLPSYVKDIPFITSSESSHFRLKIGLNGPKFEPIELKNLSIHSE